VNENFEYQLIRTDDRLVLSAPAEKKFTPLAVDFAQGKARHRREYPGKELLAKAIGYKKSSPPTVLDATAGLGADSFLLASLGCQVFLCERSKVIAALLADGLARASQQQETASIVAKMHLLTGAAANWIPQYSVDVIYLDPMYPSRTKTALVKKELRILREVVGEDHDAADLLPQALCYAKQRVVVKRPRLAEYLAGQKPDIEISGKAVRFDVYLIKSREIT
jgi:16S rRNA (guanine1516-N2)-methyltransferase